MDEAGVLVNLTQFRNILTGTIPQPNPYQTPSPTVNQDANRVMFGTDANNHPIYYYLPNSVADNFDFTTTGQVFRTGIPVPGRWGEADFIPGNPNTNPPRPVLSTPNIPFNNLVRAGMSMSYYNSASNSFMFRDIDDDNYNTFDPVSGESADYHDAAGALSIPVERIRRYTTPIDAAGDGWMTAFASNSPYNGPTGADGYGRISFFKYFRPPGMPNVQWANPTTPLGIGNPVIPDKTTNPLHGFEAARNPNLYALTAPLNAQLYAAMPYDQNGGTVVPTYDALINASIKSPYLNEADEMQLYQGSPFDTPFGPNDLEWLYRLQDSDGSSLQSRLSSLAPISFTNGIDDLRRRRLFALDSWETTNFVWSYDNPVDVSTGGGTSPATTGSVWLPRRSPQASRTCTTALWCRTAP